MTINAYHSDDLAERQATLMRRLSQHLVGPNLPPVGKTPRNAAGRPMEREPIADRPATGQHESLPDLQRHSATANGLVPLAQVDAKLIPDVSMPAELGLRWQATKWPSHDRPPEPIDEPLQRLLLILEERDEVLRQEFNRKLNELTQRQAARAAIRAAGF